MRMVARFTREEMRDQGMYKLAMVERYMPKAQRAHNELSELVTCYAQSSESS